MSFIAGVKFIKKTFLAHGGAGTGLNPESPLPIADGNLWAIPAGLVIDRMFVIINTLVGGTSDLDIGDDDDADGFVDGSLSLTLGTVGLYSANAKVAGAYLRVQTAGVADATDIYVVPTSKYYSAAGKTVKADATGSSSAGKLVIVTEGYVGENLF